MILFPAIDLVNQKAVRLLKGDYSQMTIYSDKPIEVAKIFEMLGARHIHMVDLEGARDGGTPNLSVVEQVARETGLFVEVGGGVRSMETIARYFEAGVNRVILGTAAVSDEALLREAAAKYGEKIAVGADVRDGFIPGGISGEDAEHRDKDCDLHGYFPGRCDAGDQPGTVCPVECVL